MGRRGVGVLGDFRLENHDVGWGRGQRGRGRLDGDGAVGSGIEDDRVLARCAHGDEGRAGGPVDLAQMRDVHAVRGQVCAQARPGEIRADGADEDDGDSRACGGRGLVCALAAEAVRQGGAREGFARIGEAINRDRNVLIDGTDDDDACHGCSFARRYSIVPRAPATQAVFPERRMLGNNEAGS